MRRRQAKKIAKRIGWAAVCYSLASPCLGTYFHGYRHSTIRKLWRHRPPILRPVRQKQKPISYLVPNQSYAEFVELTFQRCCAALGIPREICSGDSNYSSARLDAAFPLMDVT
jgi:hypothetical protein